MVVFRESVSSRLVSQETSGMSLMSPQNRITKMRSVADRAREACRSWSRLLVGWRRGTRGRKGRASRTERAGSGFASKHTFDAALPKAPRDSSSLNLHCALFTRRVIGRVVVTIASRTWRRAVFVNPSRRRV